MRSSATQQNKFFRSQTSPIKSNIKSYFLTFFYCVADVGKTQFFPPKQLKFGKQIHIQMSVDC